jgi:signal recognition particle receptor subunit beta
MGLPLFTSSTALITAVLGLLIALFLYLRSRGGGSSAAAGAAGSSQSRSAVARAAKGAVLLCGPPGGGKTVLFHRLAFGRGVDTVPSAFQSAVFTALAGAPAGSAPLKLMDYPGAPQLRASLLRSARECSGVVVLVDAAGAAAHVQQAADVLFDLLTDPAVVRGAPRFLVAASRADAPGARALPQLRALLETELERLRGTRGAIMQAGEGALRDAGGAEDQTLLLGRVGERFSFEVDAPLRVEWGEVGGLAAGSDVNVSAVRTFVAEAAAS